MEYAVFFRPLNDISTHEFRNHSGEVCPPINFCTICCHS